MKLILSITLGIILASVIMYLVEVAVVVHFVNQTVEYFQSESDKQRQQAEEKRLARLKAENLILVQTAEQRRISTLKQLE